MPEIRIERMPELLAACRAQPDDGPAALATYVAASEVPAGGTWLHLGPATAPLAGAAAALPSGTSMLVVADGSPEEWDDIVTAVKHLRDCRPDIRIKVVKDDPLTWFRVGVTPTVVFVAGHHVWMNLWRDVCTSFYGTGSCPAGGYVLAPNLWSYDALEQRAGGWEEVPGPTDRPVSLGEGDSGHAGSDWCDTGGL